MAGQPLIVEVFGRGASERWLYEDDGQTFDYTRGEFARRRFSMRADGAATVIEVSAPEGSYRPAARDLVLRLRGDAKRVSVGGAPAEFMARDGVVEVKVPDRFERIQIRIE
jgi:hypothetical protein